jgi:hypothetical protein
MAKEGLARADMREDDGRMSTQHVTQSQGNGAGGQQPPRTAGPRLLRVNGAAAYCGLTRNAFNRIIRPFVTEIRMTRQVPVFDRRQLDEAIDQLMDGASCFQKKGVKLRGR